MFSAVNCVRLLGVDGEIALSRSTEKFINRFSLMENEVLKSGKSLTDLNLNELDKIYEKVKRDED